MSKLDTTKIKVTLTLTQHDINLILVALNRLPKILDIEKSCNHALKSVTTKAKRHATKVARKLQGYNQ